MKWTDKQLNVINTRDRNILVSAAAGSGKTAVLVERIIRMITDSENPVDIDQLLVVTFTRAAASEMRERIREALETLATTEPDNLNVQKQLSFIHNARITTIDSFCASVVKENFDKIDLDPDFRIADETEIEMLKADIIEEMLEEYYDKAEPEFIKLAEQYSSGKLADNIGELIGLLYKYASGYHNPEKWVKKCAESYYVESAEALENSQWMEAYLDTLRNQMESWINNLNKARVISECPDGPQFGEKIDAYIEMIDCVRRAETYSKMREQIRQIGTVKWVAVKGCDEDKKKQVAGMKSQIAAAIKDMRENDLKQNIEQLYKDVCESRAGVEMIVNLTLDFMTRFKVEKADKGIMDFNDQAHFALDILTEEEGNGNLIPSETAKDMSHQFKEIMIDEYQDSNYIQEAILSSVSGGFGINNMFMVGDVKQSIYRFRQAEPKLFIGKYDTYSEELTADNCKIILDKNFRSRKEVIDSVNYIFNYIMHRQVGGIDYKNGNQLALGADYDEAPAGQNNDTEFVIIEGDDKKTEAEYVAQKIREITDPVTGMKITEKDKGMRPVRYGDIAILLRSMKGVSELYQEHLENNGIPSFAESKTGYYQTMEVRTIVALLSIIDNPRQDIPLATVMVSPMFAFTSNELAVIKTENERNCLYDTVVAYSENGDDKKLASKVNAFLEMLNKFRNMVPYTSVYELINFILSETGYEYYIKSMPNGKKRYLNIEALKEKAVAYDSISYKGLFNFVRYIEKVQYLAKDDGEASAVSENDNIVHIMSIHKSKGLQFPVVFVCNTAGQFRNDTDKIVADDDGNIGIDCIDNKLKTKTPTIFKKVIKAKNKEEDMAETLRILYVALTRAKEKLFITGRTKELEKTIAGFAECKYDINNVMVYNDIVGANCMMDWVGKTIGKNKAFNKVAGTGDDIEMEGGMYDTDCDIQVSSVYSEDIVFNQLQEEVTDEIKKEALALLQNPKLTDESVRKMLDSYFAFEYPYKEDITRHSKASVTEIKKQSMAHDEEQDGHAPFADKQGQDLRNKPEKLLEIIPDFIKKEQQMEIGLTGAQRGTAYHRIFELLDMDAEEYSVETVKKMIEGFVTSGMIDREGADAVNPEDVVKFTETDLFKRMKAAHKRGELFRERKFLMGIPTGKVGENSNDNTNNSDLNNSDSVQKDPNQEIMIIQGIIDACFVEDGQYVIMDYKTDRVNCLEQLVDTYHVQLECYQAAIEQISEMTVKDVIIYSVYLGDEISINKSN